MKELPFINLGGDIPESFYQLGRKDREHFLDVSDHLKALVTPNPAFLGPLISGGLHLLSRNVLKNHPALKDLIAPYAEGLDLSVEALTSNFLIPELLSCLHLLFPPIPAGLFGCSSFFLWSPENKSALHGRIMDFPLVGSYEKGERGILYSFPRLPKIWSYSTAGLPYPSLTAMSSEGITLAIHQKFNKTFHAQGIPIFHIAWKILSECHNSKSVVNLVKSLPSLTTWGLYLSFASGEVLAVDICGDQKYFKFYDLKKEKTLYFNNIPLRSNPLHKEKKLLPFGVENYCRMRELSAHKKLGKLGSLERPSDLDLLEVMGRPLSNKKGHAREWNLDVLTYTTLASVTLDAVQGKTLFIPGAAPKILSKEVLEIKNLWDEKSKFQTQILSRPGKPPKKTFALGLRHTAMAQSAYDRKDFSLAFHHIQMSMDYFDEYPEKWIATFYFLVFEYIHMENPKDFPHLLKRFYTLKDKLPSYLNDHCLLFVARLEVILHSQTKVNAREIHHEGLRKLWNFERALPPLILKKLRSLIVPQLGILDVLYLYFKGD